jgi:DNA modification methylase
MNIRDRIKELRRVPANELKPNPKNWRTHPKEQLDAIRGVLSEVGFAGAELARELPDGTLELIDGHARAEVAGTADVPVLILDVNEAEANKILATFDPIGAMADSDAAKLESVLADVETGNAALQSMLKDLAESADLDFGDEPEIEQDEVPEPPADPITQYGDLWELGDHRLLCGNSTVAADLERLMDGKKADLWLTDPPYNISYVGKTADALTIQNDSLANEEFRKFLNGAVELAFDQMKAGASFYVWHAHTEAHNFIGSVVDAGQTVRQCLVWAKNKLVMGRQDYHWQHEPCLYGWKKGASHGWYTDRKQTTLMHFESPTQSSEHPTMKPVELFAYQIGNSTAPQGLVLDTFIGSGTTMIASQQLGRTTYGMELSEAYCDVVVQRWESLTGNKAVRKPR